MKYAILFALVAASTASVAAAQLPRQVMIRAGFDVESCPDTGEVRGLNPRGDNFLSVRAGPNVRARELDRLRQGEQVMICDRVGQWWGVVYSRTPGADCNIVPSATRRTAYAGPCRSGWVSGRYIGIVGG